MNARKINMKNNLVQIRAKSTQGTKLLSQERARKYTRYKVSFPGKSKAKNHTAKNSFNGTKCTMLFSWEGLILQMMQSKIASLLHSVLGYFPGKE